jgi:hypothetical protein
VEGEAGGFNRKNLVEYMTTGDATSPYQAPSSASAPMEA